MAPFIYEKVFKKAYFFKIEIRMVVAKCQGQKEICYVGVGKNSRNRCK